MRGEPVDRQSERVFRVTYVYQVTPTQVTTVASRCIAANEGDLAAEFSRLWNGNGQLSFRIETPDPRLGVGKEALMIIPAQRVFQAFIEELEEE